MFSLQVLMHELYNGFISCIGIIDKAVLGFRFPNLNYSPIYIFNLLVDARDIYVVLLIYSVISI